MEPKLAPRKLLFVVTEDVYFVSHRLSLAVEAMKSDFVVSVATRVTTRVDEVIGAGIKIIDIPIKRGGLNPWKDFKYFLRLCRTYRTEQPSIVHHVGMKPVVYGSIAARWVGIPAIVNALPGLGYVFNSQEILAKSLRAVVRPLLRLVLNGDNSRLILQNKDNIEILVSQKLIQREKIRLIRGAGVDLENYRKADVEIQPPLIILIARLLRDKGVGEFVAAAKEIRKQGISARFALLGDIDLENPASFSKLDIERFAKDGTVELLGWRDDIPYQLSQSQIVCLPSYHEGLPKALLEGAAAGCALVATDIPGCREIVKDNETGKLVPPRDFHSLAKCLEILIGSPTLRRQLGNAARKLVSSEFSSKQIAGETLAVYEELLLR